MLSVPENYRKVSELSEMQEMLKELMHEFHCICDKYGLIYNMWGGTLLGAIRHQNMIPWDDDVDVSMPRKDYEKLIEIVEKEYADQFDVFSYPKENYFYPFGKFCQKNTVLIEGGLKPQYAKVKLYIDIFPLDGIPSLDKKLLQKRYNRVLRNQTYMYCCVSANDAIPDKKWKKALLWLKPLRSAIFDIWGYKYFLKKQIEETTRYPFEDCEYVAFVSGWGGKQKGIMCKAEYLRRKLYKFGDYEFWGQENAHEWLANWYGDYMTPPPENQRCAAHNYELYVEAEK